MTKLRTVGELRQIGYAPSASKTTVRRNLILKLERGERIFPGSSGTTRPSSAWLPPRAH
jgi:magnesium chelatase subunit I